jgi:hypothetical protein
LLDPSLNNWIAPLRFVHQEKGIRSTFVLHKTLGFGKRAEGSNHTGGMVDANAQTAVDLANARRNANVDTLAVRNFLYGKQDSLLVVLQRTVSCGWQVAKPTGKFAMESYKSFLPIPFLTSHKGEKLNQPQKTCQN